MMPPLQTRSIKISALLVVVAMVLLLFRGFAVETYRDDKIISGEVRKPGDVFMAHVSRTRYLKIHGKTYHRIRGLPPFYLDVPNTKSILFVNQESGNPVTIHIVNYETGDHIQFDAGGSGFGWSIGGARKPGEKYTDYIESANTNKITIAKWANDWKEIMVLDLFSGTIVRRETIDFDATGQITNRSVRTPSKAAGLKK